MLPPLGRISPATFRKARHGAKYPCRDSRGYRKTTLSQSRSARRLRRALSETCGSRPVALVRGCILRSMAWPAPSESTSRPRHRWSEVLRPAAAVARTTARRRLRARPRRQSPTALRPVLLLHPAVSVQPDRHVAARPSAGQRTEERAEEAAAARGPRSARSPKRPRSSIPEPLKEIIAELAAQLEPLGRDRQFPRSQAPDHRRRRHASSRPCRASCRRPTCEVAHRRPVESAWRLHTHFEVDRGVPVRIDVTGADRRRRATTNGPCCERTLEAGSLLRAWTAGTPSSRCSTTSSPPAAATSAACATTASTTCWSSERPLSAEADAAERLAIDAWSYGHGPQGRRPARPSGAAGLRSQTTPHHKPRQVRRRHDRARAATACCGSPPTCSTCRPRSSR